MSLFDWFADRRKNAPLVRSSQETSEDDGLWSKCPECALVVYRKDLIANASVCSNCGHHHRIDAATRITGRTITVVETDRRPGDPPALVGGSQRARQILGWNPQYSDLDTILTHAWGWHQQRHG